MAILDLFPAKVAIGYANVGGQNVPILASPEFIRALGAVFLRLGGATGQSVTDLAQSDDDDSGLEEFKSEVAKALKGLDMEPRPVFEPAQADPLPPVVFEPFTDPMHPLAQPSEVQQLQTELSGLREEVQRLRSVIYDIQQGTTL